MKPDALESIRGLQAWLLEVVGPELSSAQAQDSLQTAFMLLETLAAEWDSAANDLVSDNIAIAEILTEAMAMPAFKDRVVELDPTSVKSPPSLRMSDLRDQNDALSLRLERLVVAIESLPAGSPSTDLRDFRARVYRHSRETAARGWSFWDVLSFNSSLGRSREGPTRDQTSL